MHAMKQAFSRPIASAIGVGVLVAAAIMLVAVTRPTEYTARIGLLAAPAAEAPQSPPSADFPAVVSLSMAAVVEAAHSPSVVAKASSATNGALSPQQVFDAVSVELVPGSGLARVMVKASSPIVAADVASSIGNDLVGQNLFGPAGGLRLLDSRPDVREVQPDIALNGGLAMAAGVTAAVAMFGLMTLVRPSDRKRIEHALGAAGIRNPVAIVDGGDPSDVVREIERIAKASGQPLRVIPLTKSTERDAEKLSLELDLAGVRVAEDDRAYNSPVVGVVTKDDSMTDLRCMAAAIAPSTRLLAVVLQ
jgi:capsular polysaccharide biosynthesis protein